MFPGERKGSVCFHRLTPITGARPMAGGGDETYKHTLTWNQKWGADSFEVAAEAKSFDMLLDLFTFYVCYVGFVASEDTLMTLMSMRTPRLTS